MPRVLPESSLPSTFLPPRFAPSVLFSLASSSHPLPLPKSEANSPSDLLQDRIEPPSRVLLTLSSPPPCRARPVLRSPPFGYAELEDHYRRHLLERRYLQRVRCFLWKSESEGGKTCEWGVVRMGPRGGGGEGKKRAHGETTRWSL